MSVRDKVASKLPVVGERVDRSPVVSVLRLHGVITPTPAPLSRGVINLAGLESAITRAFSHDRLAAVALSVNSPGGSGTQSALVADRIMGLAKEKNVPVLAFCEDLAASGGYWLACAADEIYAHATSLVGSIGVVSSGFGFTGLLDRLGVERRVHTAGASKVRLDAFRPEKAEDVAWLEKMQSELHEQFVSWVRARRGSTLDTSNEDLFTGEVFTGERAKALGLIDGLGTLRGTVTERFPEAKIVLSEGRKPLLARLGMGADLRRGGLFGDPESVLQALEHRAAWSRFGI